MKFDAVRNGDSVFIDANIFILAEVLHRLMVAEAIEKKSLQTKIVTTQVCCLLPYMDQGNRVAVNHADTVGLVQKRQNRTKRLTT